MKLSGAISGYLLQRSTELSPETIKTERVWLEQFCAHTGSIDVDDVGPTQVRDFLLYQRDRGLSPFSVRRNHCSISSFYTWATDPEIGLASRDPTNIVPPPKLPKRKPKALSRKEVEALVEAASEVRMTRRSRALVLFLVDTGCRCSEVCGVKMDDIDFKTGKVLVEGKGSKQRYCFLGSRARSAVWLYAQEARPEPAQIDKDCLFLTERGDTMSRYCLREAIVRLGEKAGVHATPHMFRHTAAITHLRNGMKLVELQHMLGHSDITTTRGYLDSLADDDVERVAQRTSPSDNWKL